MALVAALVALASVAGRGAAPKFFPDDPVLVDDDRAFDASGAKEIEAGDYHDFVENTFFAPGERRDVPAMNVNTLGEVPDSSWFTNRIGRRPMSIQEILRGPERFQTLSIDGWPIVRDKGEGLQAGFRVADPSGHLYQIELDPETNPEMATGAEIVGTLFYHAMGYHVVDVYFAVFDPEKTTISPKATIRDITGKRRPFTRRDLDDVLRRSARQGDGKYRVLASRFADGAPLGNFRYYGTRPDDPNDVFPHEHRRELRGNRVFAAWLNHDDSRGLNSLDMLEQSGGKKWVKHYMFDFGSIMGSGTAFAQVPRAGNEHILDWKEGFRTLGSLGIYLRPWLLVKYPDVPASVGRFEADYFDPEGWKPEYPNPAFENMRPEDAFWAARIVAQFTDDIIRAVVEKAEYSDPRATDYITGTLIKRRDKVLRAWLTKINPLVNPRLSPSGEFTFENAAVDAKIATPHHYTPTWFRFDNAIGVHTQVGQSLPVQGTRAQAPEELIRQSRPGDYISVMVRAHHADYPNWMMQPARVYFRRTADGWQTVGIERMKEGSPGSRPGG